MNSLLAKWLGLDAARVPADAQSEFLWTHAPQSWHVFLFLAVAGGLLYGVFHLYRREQAVCPPRIRRALAVLRALVIVVLLLVLLGPSLNISQQRRLEPSVVVVLDDSLSMSLRDPLTNNAAPPTRIEAAANVLNRDGGRLLRELSAKGRLRVVSFAGGAPLAEGATNAVPAPTPRGTTTDLSRGVRDALRGVAGHPVAGIVLLTDGQHNDGDDPLDVVEAARQQKAPLFPIGIGDPAEPRNWRVAELWAPDTVFRDDPFVIQVRVQATGAGGRPATVELLQKSATAEGADPGRVVATKTVALDPASGVGSVAFEQKLTAAGACIYTARVPVEPGEAIPGDNTRSVPVKVLTEPAKVLLVAGAPTWDFQAVRTLLIRDKTVDVSCWLQSMDTDMRQDGDTVISRLPQRPEDYFQYDAILMLDPNPAEFNAAWVEAMRRYVGEHGGGLFWQAGAKFSEPFFRRTATMGIADLLPVQLGAESGRGEPLTLTHTREWPLRVTPDGADHALLRLHPDPMRNRRLVEMLTGVYWSYPAGEAKPGTQTLVEHSDPRLNMRGKARPLLVTGQYGAGRTVFLGFDGTWRWRRFGEKIHDQFWMQSVRYLFEGRRVGGQNRGRLGTDRDLYAIGDRIAMTARLYDKSFKPLETPTVPAQVRALGAAPVEVALRAVPGRPGHYAGTGIAAQLGLGEVTVTLGDDGGGKPAQLSKSFTVEVPRLEFTDTRLNRALLGELAQRSGGRYFEATNTAALAALLPDRHETVVVRGRPVELWDNSRLLLLLAGLLTVEWALRRRFRLL